MQGFNDMDSNLDCRDSLAWQKMRDSKGLPMYCAAHLYPFVWYIPFMEKMLHEIAGTKTRMLWMWDELSKPICDVMSQQENSVFEIRTWFFWYKLLNKSMHFQWCYVCHLASNKTFGIPRFDFVWHLHLKGRKPSPAKKQIEPEPTEEDLTYQYNLLFSPRN